MADDADAPAEESLLRCSFCNKSQFQIRKLVAGPLATICDQCVRTCADIVGDGRSSGSSEAPVEHIGWPGGVFCSLCHAELEDDAVVVEKRGLICMTCAAEVERAVARLRKASR